MCGGNEAFKDACNEVIEQDFPGWHAWRGTRQYARRPGTSPPVVIGRATEGELREALILAQARTASRDGYWGAVMAARQAEMGGSEPLPRRNRARSYWPAS